MRIFLLFLGLSCFGLNAQQGKIDSLLQIAKSNQTDSVKVQALFECDRIVQIKDPLFSLNILNLIDSLCEANIHSNVIDTLFFTEKKADALNQIGINLKNQGRFTEALGNLESSRQLFELLGMTDRVALVLNNIGNVYSRQGNYELAEEYITEGLNLYKESHDREGIAMSHSNIGFIYISQGSLNEASVHFSTALEIWKEIKALYGQSVCLHNLGAIAFYQGDPKKAIEYISLSLDIDEEMGDMRGVAGSLINLGQISYEIGEIESGYNFLVRAQNLAREYNAREELRVSTMSLAKISIESDSASSTRVFADELLRIRHKDLEINFPMLSESEKEQYFATMKKDFDLLYDISLKDNDYGKNLSNSFNLALKVKGLLLKSSTAMRVHILNSQDTLVANLYSSWIDLKKEIAKEYSQGKDVLLLEKEANEFEKELVKKSQDFADIKKVQELSWEEVQRELKEGESAIEFVRFTHQEDYRNDSDKVQLYAALIINKDSEHPKMVRLFEEAELEKILGTFPGNNLSYIEQVYGTKENTKSQLYDLIWKPMEEELKGAKKVYVSPVGLLHKISFAALAKEQDVYLCDVYDIEMKSSTGKIATDKKDTDSESSDVSANNTTTLFGGIQYNSDSTTTEIWNYLDGSLSETQQIEKILKKNKVNYNYFNQAEATEAQFKEIASKSNILHIATHGFFYQDPDLVKEDLVDEVESKEEIVFRGGRTGMGMNTFVKSRNPLMRSGLAFAGANDVWNRTSIEGEDGVLTAAEVATIDMRNTELVVLSACETGLGDIKGSEGVYGLQRSFKMAGVNYIIMSLWQVPDKETAEFMTTFYKHLTKTNDIKESFNLTQKAMRQKYDPYYWAAFVLVE